MAQRKYSATRSKAGRKVAALMLPGPCTICHRLVTADHRWQADHIVSRVVAEAQGWTTTQIDDPSNIGPAHKSCNEREGGKLTGITKRKSVAFRQVPRVVRPSLSFPGDARGVPLKPSIFSPPLEGETPQEATGAP